MTSSQTRTLRSIIGSALAILVLAGLSACSLGPTATLRLLAGEATVGGQPVSAEQGVSAGDLVEVSGSDSIAEIAWPDGSFTRLGGGSSFEVGGDGVRGTLEAGAAWSTVAAGGYVIRTPEGTVTGESDASFVVRCDGGCGGAVASAAVTLDDQTRVAAPATFVLGAGATSGPAGWDGVYGDDFALANAALDEAAGFASTADLWADADPQLASMNGTFEGPSDGLVQSCTGWAEECARVQANIFANESETFFDLTTDCASGACSVAVLFTVNASGGGSTQATAPLGFDGSLYSLDYTFGEDSYCTFPDGSTEGRWTNGITGSFQPTAAELRDGVPVVTELSAQVHNELVLVESTTDPTCAEFEYEWSSDRTADLVLQDSSSSSPAAALASFGIEAAAPPATGTGLARPSVLSELRTPAASIPSLGQLAVLGGGIVVLVLVLGYPAYLLSRVIADRYEAAVARSGKERKPRPAAVRWLLLVLGIVLASIITAALDPQFGAPLQVAFSDPGSIGTAFTAFVGDLGAARLVLTALASFIVFLGLGALVVRLVGRKVAPGVPMPLQFRWGSLVILLAGVVLSRVFELSPGIIFGLVAGLVIADSIPLAGRGRLMLASAIFAIGIGALAWTGYAILSPLSAAQPSDVVLVSATELLSALTIEAVSALPLAFLPVLGLDGFVLRKWRILVWALVYAIGLALFALVLLVVPGSWTEIQGDAVRWLIGFGAFTVVAIVIWLIHLALMRRRERQSEEGEAT